MEFIRPYRKRILEKFHPIHQKNRLSRFAFELYNDSGIHNSNLKFNSNLYSESSIYHSFARPLLCIRLCVLYFALQLEISEGNRPFYKLHWAGLQSQYSMIANWTPTQYLNWIVDLWIILKFSNKSGQSA